MNRMNNSGDIKKLADEIIQGRRINRQDHLTVFLTCDLEELCKGADRIREYFCGDKVDLCTIINGRSGRCGEDCNTVPSQCITIPAVRYMISLIPKKLSEKLCPMRKKE